MDQIFGYVERVTFTNSENGFTVARLQQSRKKELTTIVGTMPTLTPGENLRLIGEWKKHVTHGIQFIVSEYFIEKPTDLLGIQKYLESGMVRGIGPIYAERIVKIFGEQTLDIIDQSPDFLIKVNGIGQKRIEKIKSCWQAQKSIRNVMIFLQKYGISSIFAQKLYKLYGNETVSYLQANPYMLAREMRGIGFKSADKIAEKLGFPKDAHQRIDSGIEYLLTELADQGHVCYPLDELCSKAQEILEIHPQERIQTLQNEGHIVISEGNVWLKRLWIAETGIARELDRLMNHRSHLRQIDTEKAISWVEKTLNIQLAKKQKTAIEYALKKKIHIITGGPGTGKSTIINAILAITKQLSQFIILAAPTGRAAKRMSEITKQEATTIHSLLQFDFIKKGFKRNRDNPLHCDLIVIDEASMIDTNLMYGLLKAIPGHARLIIVGDVYQLPSVGPGLVLKDMIDSQIISVTALNEIFRQAAGSRIITNAHKINAGEFPDLTTEKTSDFFFLKGEEPESILDKIIELISKRLPKSYHLNPIEDIQVLAPMKRGPIGIENLNVILQKILNPQKNMIPHGAGYLGIGDKVMQIRNDYKKEVYNGDIGRIKMINQEDQELIINYEGHLVTYPFCDLDELVLAYATSIHKYQGSESPCVVIPIHTTHFMMLQRNLLYTAVTRGKKIVILIGTGKAIGIAVSNNETLKRHTGLKEALIQKTF
ncbi:MAG: ATP-dependent RecD-like DNA helicase [Chlamydiales bacterium]